MKVSEIIKKEPPKGVKKHLGKTYHNLTILEFFGYYNMKYYVRVVCKCGTERIIDISNIIYGTTKSCGCIKNKKQ